MLKNKLLLSILFIIIISSALLGQANMLNVNFGANGKVITKVGDSVDWPNSIAIQSDGKIIVAGYTQSEPENTDVALIRYNTNGSIDNSFGMNGKVIIDENGRNPNSAYDVKLQRDGKIVIIGDANAGSSNEILLMRFNSNGTLDNTFGINGIIRPRFTSNETGIALDFQNDNKIIICANNNNGQTIVARFNLDGTIDNTFDTDGYVSVRVESNNTSGRDIKVLSNGKIAVTGFAIRDSRELMATFILKPDGSFDNSFSLDGQIISDISNAAEVTSCSGTTIMEQSDSKILIQGTYESNGPPVTGAVAIIRLNQDGTYDDTFDGDGVLLSNLALGRIRLGKAFMQQNGKILAVGSVWTDAGFPNYLVVKFNNDGSLDNSFGINGISSINNVSHLYGTAKTFTVQSDGKVVSAIPKYFNGDYIDFHIIRQNPDGGMDNDFGVNGIVQSSLGDGNTFAADIVKQPDNKIVIGGGAFLLDYKMLLARFNTNGTSDNSFNQDGLYMDSFGNNQYNFVKSIALQNDGKIVAGGISKQFTTGKDLSLARFSSDGNLDLSFGTNGFVTTDIDSKQDVLSTIKLQSDGKIVALGEHYLDSGPSEIVLTRYDSNGSVDNTFNGNGIVKFGMSDAELYGNCLTIQSDGKLLIGGFLYRGGRGYALVARFNTNGTLDNTFSDDGYNLYSWIEMTSNIATAILTQPDGKIVVGGYSRTATESRGFIIRINPDGNYDLSFNLTGVVAITAGGLATINT